MNPNSSLAQPTRVDAEGRIHLVDDWYPSPLPKNIFFDDMSYPDTSYSFTSFYSKKPLGMTLGYASGNYGHGVFNTGENGEIRIGKFVVLQATRIICNRSVSIGDHCMFSWGSVITDSWLEQKTSPIPVRRIMMEAAARSPDRHLEFAEPRPIVIEANVWVGFDAIVMPGVRIGRGAVVGCKVVVTDDVPPYAVVIGNPAKVIRTLEPTDTEETREKALSKFLSK